VLIVKVRPEILEKQKLPTEKNGKLFWNQRYEDINMFERHLVRNGTVILKFFLNVSKKEQKQRLLERLEHPDKEWKFSLTDLSERSKWPDYMEAYEDVLNKTSTEWAPWYIIPADKKWVVHASVSEIILSQIKKLDLEYPVLSKEESAALENAKAELKKE
jgi:polyphosphate kinase 2 (PPK2 family)